MNVFWVHPRGRWDEGLLMCTIRSIPGVIDYNVPPPTDEGVVAALSHRIDTDIVRTLGKYPWVLAVHTSDESHEWNANEIKRTGVKLWMQYPTPAQSGDRNILIGCQEDTQKLLPELKALKDRPYEWAFSGQVNHAKRYEMAKTLESCANGQFRTSPGFSQGLTREEHLRLLANSRIAPCPSGSVHPDSFRLYEALEAGCYPICDSPGFWQWMHVPVATVENWSELPDLMARYDLDTIQRETNKVAAWWHNYKLDFARNLVQDVENLSGTPIPRDEPTILIPTSPIPSHPNITHIQNCIERVRSYLPTSEIIIMVDGWNVVSYDEYVRRLLEYAKHAFNIRVVIFDQHLHQTGMTKKVLETVTTKYLFYVEHDTYPMGEIPFTQLLGLLARDDVNSIRLFHYAEVHPDHTHLFGKPQDVGGLPLMKTFQWSQRPHLAKVSWYKQILNDYCQRNDMIEDIMYYVCKDAGWAGWMGMWVYSPEGNMVRSGHSYGRTSLT